MNEVRRISSKELLLSMALISNIFVAVCGHEVWMVHPRYVVSTFTCERGLDYSDFTYTASTA